MSVFNKIKKPKTIYSNREKHFDNQKIKDYIKIKKVTLILGPNDLSKLFKIIKQSNGLLKDVLRKNI